MTIEELYRQYLKWVGEKTELTQAGLCQSPVLNKEVYENEEMVISHLYYLIVNSKGRITRHFIFYEENTFHKTQDEDLVLVHDILSNKWGVIQFLGAPLLCAMKGCCKKINFLLTRNSL